MIHVVVVGVLRGGRLAGAGGRRYLVLHLRLGRQPRAVVQGGVRVLGGGGGGGRGRGGGGLDTRAQVQREVGARLAAVAAVLAARGRALGAAPAAALVQLVVPHQLGLGLGLVAAVHAHQLGVVVSRGARPGARVQAQLVEERVLLLGVERVVSVGRGRGARGRGRGC